MPDASALFSEVSSSVQDLINASTASFMPSSSSSLAARAAPARPAPRDANVVCVESLLQFATTPEEEQAWRELALADRKLALAEREQRLAMEMREREQKMAREASQHRMNVQLVQIDISKREADAKHVAELRENSRKRTVDIMALETDPVVTKGRILEMAVARLSESLIMAPSAKHALAYERPLINRLMELRSFPTEEHARAHVSTLWRRGQMIGVSAAPPPPPQVEPQSAAARNFATGARMMQAAATTVALPATAADAVAVSKRARAALAKPPSPPASAVAAVRLPVAAAPAAPAAPVPAAPVPAAAEAAAALLSLASASAPP